MTFSSLIGALSLAVLLAGCGGGGGDAGTAPFGTGSGSTGGTAATATAYSMTTAVTRGGVSTTEITSTETVQAVATVVTGSGAPVEGAVVVFTQAGAGPALTFAPVAATALTSASGVASVDFSAASATSTGATTVTASTTIAAVAATASKSIQIVAGTVSGGTPAVPAAINFIGSLPNATAIVVKGAGGSGRSESAVLTFRVVDASNAPINAAAVTFTLNASNGGAVLKQTSAVSNSDGQVTVTVSSGSLPASIVVTASVAGTSVTSQSDTLIVSNSVPVSGGFEVVANKYNLDGRKTGDVATITAYVRDQFGNPVPDGVAVSFTTDYGVVATSTLGGCTTLNGTCNVTLRVQDPRPPAGGLVTVTGTVRVGTSTQLIQNLKFNFAGSRTSYLALNPSTGTASSTLTLTSCKQSLELLLSDGAGLAPAAGAAITVGFASSDLAVSVPTGSPTLDQLASGFPPLLFSFLVDVTSTALRPACNPTGTVMPSGLYFRAQHATPGGTVFTQRFDLSYPQ